LRIHWFQRLLTASQLRRKRANSSGLIASSVPATKPCRGASRLLRPMRSGATAPVGSARTQPTPVCQNSAQACAEL